eukprot:g4491.t1
MGNVCSACEEPEVGPNKQTIDAAPTNKAEAGNEVPEYAEKTYSIGKYQGQLLGGKRSGQGVLYYSNGALYDGQWANDRFHGTGKYSDKDSSYSGLWADGKKHGVGEEVSKVDGTYQGQYVQGDKHGQGVYTWPDGSRYEGEFEKNNVQGFGKLSDPTKCHQKWAFHPSKTDGSVYEGQFLDNMQHGAGKSDDGSGLLYDGEWKEGEKCGKGQETNTKTGVMYVGQFLEDLKHGSGVEKPVRGGAEVAVTYEKGVKK